MKRLLLAFLLFSLLLTTAAQSGVITGKVVSIADGDTITILDSNKTQHKIRLYGIDTPEKSQAFGNAAKKSTANLTALKTAEVIAYDTDRYGRTVGVVMIDGENVNQGLINAGFAWQYREYCKEAFCTDWIGLEGEARKARMGLWADTNPQAPWDYRKGQRSNTASSSTINNTASTGGYHGNSKSHGRVSLSELQKL